MANLYITADKIGLKTGGGIVTEHEYQALSTIGGVIAIGNSLVQTTNGMLDPFATDIAVRDYLSILLPHLKIELAHIYAGCFTETVKLLHRNNIKVSYTVAAHDPKESQIEHEKLGYSFPYPHLTEPMLWNKYTEGYREADLMITPSNAAAEFQRSIGCKNVHIIPHGTHIPDTVMPFPKRFNVGYIGQYGPDKGVLYLLQAWKTLNLPNASLLLGGAGSYDAISMVRGFCAGNIEIKGFVPSISDFYNECSVYCQPSVTEGFGIEVPEAMAHGRPVICSKGAGAADCITDEVDGYIVEPRFIAQIIEKIKVLRELDIRQRMGQMARETANKYSWNSIRYKYTRLWKTLL